MLNRVVSSLYRYYRIRDFDRYQKQYEADKARAMAKYLSQYFRKCEIDNYKIQMKYGFKNINP